MATIEVIIPYYQREAGILTRALKSILAQGVEGVRVIVVDDASPHPARLELADLPDANGVVFDLVEQANTGAGGARNTGLRNLSDDCRIVCLLDSDDEWAPGHLARVTRVLALPDVDFYWSAVSQDEQFAENYAAPSRRIDASLQAPLDGVDEAFEVLNPQKILVDPWYDHMHLSTTAISARLARKVDFKSHMRIADDFDFYCQCAVHAVRTASSDAVGVARGTGDNIWHGVNPIKPIFAQENFNTMSILKWFRTSDRLDAADQEKIRKLLAHARRNFLWSQARRLKSGQPPMFGLMASWLIKDPALLGEVASIFGDKFSTGARTA